MDGQKPEDNQNQAPVTMQFAPGDTIRPQQQSTEQPASVGQPVPTTPLPAPQSPPVQQSEPAAPQSTPPQAPEPLQPTMNAVAAPQFTAQSTFGNGEGDENGAYSPTPTSNDVVNWTASEFIAHQKTSGWYALLLLASCVAAALIWFITRDIVSSVVVIFAAGVLASYAARKPRQLSYQLDPSGLTIDSRHYSYNEFRSFSVVPEGAFSSIVFSPLKRFGTLVTIYYDPKDENQIIEVISQRLPHEERRPDPIDSMLHRIRF